MTPFQRKRQANRRVLAEKPKSMTSHGKCYLFCRNKILRNNKTKRWFSKESGIFLHGCFGYNNTSKRELAHSAGRPTLKGEQ